MDPLQHFRIGNASRRAGGSLKSSQTSWLLRGLSNQKRDKRPPRFNGRQTLHSKPASLPCLPRTQGVQTMKLGVAQTGSVINLTGLMSSRGWEPTAALEFRPFLNTNVLNERLQLR